jgi:Spy/CpxP family protein refolding chaperone
MKEKILVGAAFVLTFAVGVLTGAIIVREFARPPFPPVASWRAGERPMPMPLRVLEERLNLSEAQHRQVVAIVEKYQEQLRQHMSQVRPQTHQIIQQMRREIDSVLTPEQREKFHREFPLPRWGRMPRWPREIQEDTTFEMPLY